MLNLLQFKIFKQKNPLPLDSPPPISNFQKFLQGNHLLLLLLDRDHRHDLTQHDNTVAIHEGDTGETLAVLEGVSDQRLLRLEGDLGHLVGLQVVGLFHLLTTGLLAHLPLNSHDTARSATAADETDGRVTGLDLVGDIQDLDLSFEALDGGQTGILLVDHNVTTVGHVGLIQVLNVQTDVVTGDSGVSTLVMHLNGEHLTDARVGAGVGGKEDNFFVGLDDTLFDTASQDIADTLDLVDGRDGGSHGSRRRTFGDTAHLLEAVVQGVDVDGLLLDEHILALPPVHVGGRLHQVVTAPTGDGHVRHRLLEEVLLPADLAQHVFHLVGDLLVTVEFVAGDIAIHLVDTDDDLLDTQQVDQTSVLTSLTLDLTGLVVTTVFFFF